MTMLVLPHILMHLCSTIMIYNKFYNFSLYYPFDPCVVFGLLHVFQEKTFCIFFFFFKDKEFSFIFSMHLQNT